MRKLLEKIRKILKDRRTRQLLTRTVSVTAAIVVFCQLVAITKQQGLRNHEVILQCGSWRDYPRA